MGPTPSRSERAGGVREGGSGGQGGQETSCGPGAPGRGPGPPRLGPLKAKPAARSLDVGVSGNDFKKGTSTTCSGTRAHRGCSELWEAGERPGSACAIEVEGLRRRPPTQGGGLGLEFRV